MITDSKTNNTVDGIELYNFKFPFMNTFAIVNAPNDVVGFVPSPSLVIVLLQFVDLMFFPL